MPFRFFQYRACRTRLQRSGWIAAEMFCLEEHLTDKVCGSMTRRCQCCAPIGGKLILDIRRIRRILLLEGFNGHAQGVRQFQPAVVDPGKQRRGTAQDRSQIEKMGSGSSAARQDLKHIRQCHAPHAVPAVESASNPQQDGVQGDPDTQRKQREWVRALLREAGYSGIDAKSRTQSVRPSAT